MRHPHASYHLRDVKARVRNGQYVLLGPVAVHQPEHLAAAHELQHHVQAVGVLRKREGPNWMKPVPIAQF